MRVACKSANMHTLYEYSEFVQKMDFIVESTALTKTTYIDFDGVSEINDVNFQKKKYVLKEKWRQQQQQQYWLSVCDNNSMHKN